MSCISFGECFMEVFAMAFYTLLFLVPKRKGKLIPEDELTSIRKHYEKDWEHIQSIAVPILPQAR